MTKLFVQSFRVPNCWSEEKARYDESGFSGKCLSIKKSNCLAPFATIYIWNVTTRRRIGGKDGTVSESSCIDWSTTDWRTALQTVDLGKRAQTDMPPEICILSKTCQLAFTIDIKSLVVTNVGGFATSVDNVPGENKNLSFQYGDKLYICGPSDLDNDDAQLRLHLCTVASAAKPHFESRVEWSRNSLIADHYSVHRRGQKPQKKLQLQCGSPHMHIEVTKHDQTVVLDNFSDNSPMTTNKTDRDRWLVGGFQSASLGITRSNRSRVTTWLTEDWPVTFFVGNNGKLSFSVKWKRCIGDLYGLGVIDCQAKVYGPQEHCRRCKEANEWDCYGV